MKNKATLLEEYDTIVIEYDVELFGAYEGKYHVVQISDSGLGSRMFVTVGAAQQVYITNQDIINLIKETINKQ